MPHRPADIPDLRPERLQKLIERFMAPPNLLFLNKFGEDNAPSDKIEWESQVGNRGLTPFVAPGTKSPMTAPTGVAQHSAKCGCRGSRGRRSAPGVTFDQKRDTIPPPLKP